MKIKTLPNLMAALSLFLLSGIIQSQSSAQNRQEQINPEVLNLVGEMTQRNNDLVSAFESTEKDASVRAVCAGGKILGTVVGAGVIQQTVKRCFPKRFDTVADLLVVASLFASPFVAGKDGVYFHPTHSVEAVAQSQELLRRTEVKNLLNDHATEHQNSESLVDRLPLENDPPLFQSTFDAIAPLVGNDAYRQSLVHYHYLLTALADGFMISPGQEVAEAEITPEILEAIAKKTCRDSRDYLANASGGNSFIFMSKEECEKQMLSVLTETPGKVTMITQDDQSNESSPSPGH